MTKENKNKEDAVTIIALSVTIIVILVLASVSISMVLNKNGIIAKTEESASEYQNAVIKEKHEIDEANIELSNNNLIRMFKNGEIHVGDYVNYKIPESGYYETQAFGNENSNGFATQIYEINNNETEINWRVLGLGDENGDLTLKDDKGISLLLISGSPVQKVINEESENEYDKNPYLFMGKAEGYENASNILNGISNIYLNEKYAEKARSINAKDLNTLLDVVIDYEKCKVYKGNDEENNIDFLRTMGSMFYYNQSTYSAESYAKNRSNCTQGNIISTAYSYEIDTFRNSIIGELLFSQNDMSSGYAKSYWLDSKGIDVGRIASFCIGKVSIGGVSLGNGEFKSNGKWKVFGLGVYPIIVLKHNITNEEIQVVTKSEEQWEYKTNLCYSGNIDNYETIGTKQRIFE